MFSFKSTNTEKKNKRGGALVLREATNYTLQDGNYLYSWRTRCWILYLFIYLFIFKAIAVPISFALLYLPSVLYEYIVDAVSILRKLAFVL